MCFYESFNAVACKLLPCFAMDGRHSRWDTDTDRRRYHVCPDTETLSLTYLPDRVHCPTITADRAKPNPLPSASTLCVEPSFQEAFVNLWTKAWPQSSIWRSNYWSTAQPWQYEENIWCYKGTSTREKREDSIFWYWKHEFHQCLTWIYQTKKRGFLNSWKAWRDYMTLKGGKVSDIFQLKIQKRKLFEVDFTVVLTADIIVSNATI